MGVAELLGGLIGLGIGCYLAYLLFRWLWRIIIDLWKDILGLKKKNKVKK